MGACTRGLTCSSGHKVYAQTTAVIHKYGETYASSVICALEPHQIANCLYSTLDHTLIVRIRDSARAFTIQPHFHTATGVLHSTPGKSMSNSSVAWCPRSQCHESLLPTAEFFTLRPTIKPRRTLVVMTSRLSGNRGIPSSRMAHF